MFHWNLFQGVVVFLRYLTFASSLSPFLFLFMAQRPVSDFSSLVSESYNQGPKLMVLPVPTLMTLTLPLQRGATCQVCRLEAERLLVSRF